MLLKDGVVVEDKSAVNKLEFVAREKGSYRVEAYLPQLAKPAGDSAPGHFQSDLCKVVNSRGFTRDKPRSLGLDKVGIGRLRTGSGSDRPKAQVSETSDFGAGRRLKS